MHHVKMETPIPCQVKLNGNMPPVPVRRQLFTMEISQKYHAVMILIWILQGGIAAIRMQHMKDVMISVPGIPAKHVREPILWPVKPLMPGAFMICTAMYMSGAMIGMDHILKIRQLILKGRTLVPGV